MNPGRKCEQISSSALSAAQERPLLVPKTLLPKFPLRDPSEGCICLSSRSTGWSRPTWHTRHSKPKILEQIQMFLVVTHSLVADTPSSVERLWTKGPQKRAHSEHGRKIRGVPSPGEQIPSDVTRAIQLTGKESPEPRRSKP